jgi:MOB kinase activator 1
MKRLLRVYAHIYHAHIQEVIELGVDAHLNTNFKHFYLFIKEFNLVQEKELLPMKGRIVAIEDQLNEQVKEPNSNNAPQT